MIKMEEQHKTIQIGEIITIENENYMVGDFTGKIYPLHKVKPLPKSKSNKEMLKEIKTEVLK